MRLKSKVSVGECSEGLFEIETETGKNIFSSNMLVIFFTKCYSLLVQMSQQVRFDIFSIIFSIVLVIVFVLCIVKSK